MLVSGIKQQVCMLTCTGQDDLPFYRHIILGKGCPRYRIGTAYPLLNNVCQQLQHGVHLQNPDGQPRRVVLQQEEGVRDVMLISWSLYTLHCLKQGQL